jgi:Zn-dependent M16 (insulinase) family peptidase
VIATSTAGLFTFYSYRDPNLDSTFEAFEKSADWIAKADNVSERDIVEAKLGVFQVTISCVSASTIFGKFFSNKILLQSIQE